MADHRALMGVLKMIQVEAGDDAYWLLRTMLKEWLSRWLPKLRTVTIFHALTFLDLRTVNVLKIGHFHIKQSRQVPLSILGLMIQVNGWTLDFNTEDHLFIIASSSTQIDLGDIPSLYQWSLADGLSMPMEIGRKVRIICINIKRKNYASY